MLQLNHVTVTRGEQEILSDCTFQFKEGEVYIIVSEDPADYTAFLKCVCKERSTERGEIITWQGSTIYSAVDDVFLPGFLTIGEYLESLVDVSEGEVTVGALIKSVGLEDRDKGALIGRAKEEIRGALRIAPVYVTRPYIIAFGEPFPKEDLFCKFINDIKEERVFILATSDVSRARSIASVTDGIVLSMKSGELNPY